MRKRDWRGFRWGRQSVRACGGKVGSVSCKLVSVVNVSFSGEVC